jgi:two-component system cell cycle sensor histidine kinase/response regulator CckA
VTTIRFPIRLLTLVCLLTIVAFVWFGWILFHVVRDAKIFLDKGSRIEELRGVIVHLDEVLTMSARMAAETGDSQWEERYRQFEPQLDAAIKETVKIETNPSNAEAATKTEEANIKLVEMENRAFALVRAGRKEEAQAVLLSPEYETQKKIYVEGITSSVDQIRRKLDERLQEEHRVNLLSIIAAVFIAATSLVAWWSAARGVRGWRAQLLESFHRRAEAEQNLREAHAKLETRVKERTADLAKTNENLQAEISERKRAEWQLNIQYAISRVLTESSTLKEASARILQTVCENLNWQVGEFYSVDRRAEVLRFDDLWSAPNAQIDPFIARSRQTTFVRGVGLPGRVWASGKPIWIPDVVVDENFPRALAAKQAGLHGAFCVPILSGNEVSGVIEFLSNEIRQPDEELLRVFAVLGSQLGEFFERKRAEAGLQRSEAHTKAIVQSALDCIITIDQEGKILEFNPAAEIVFGYPRAKVLGMELAEVIIPPSLRERHRQGLNRYLATGQAKVLGKRIEILAIRSDGSEFPVELTITRLGTDEPPMFTGFIRDITERKRVEDDLRASEERYRSLFEGNPNPMWVFDSETLYFLAVNDAAVRHYGYSQDEFLTMTLKDIRPPEDIPALENELSGASGAMNSSVPCRHRRKDGALMDIEVTSHVLTWGGRRARLVLISDVTERDRAEARVREQADIINRAHDAIIILNFKDQGVAFWNSGAERLYGWSADEAMGRSIGELIFADAKDYEGPQKLLASAGEFHGEIKQVAKDGREIIVDSRATLIRNPDGTARSGLLINTDVTEQKKLETHLLRSQRLESIGTLASGVAHDLNNILTPILMCAEVLKGNPTPEDFPTLVSMIEESAKRGANVVKQVLTFARGIEGERVVIKPSHLIQEMIDIAQNTFPKTIQIIGRYTDELWSINCDPTQLHQVLLNLSVNARDTMPNGGTLTIGAENFDVDEHYASMSLGAQPGPHVMFRVTDTGAGMSRATIDKIFDPFFTTKQIGKGTGLGLSTALGIVKSHGGFISVYSELGTGTTFKVLLPAQVGEASSRKCAASPESLNGNGELILVVDDEAGILRITKMILEKHNYRFLPANDGTEALAAFAQEMGSINLVLTDIMMPYLDGVALIRAIKKMKPEMIFIASTGQGEETRVAELQSLNVGNFLTKPYDTARLLKILRDTLNGAPSNGNGSFLKHTADNSNN